MAASAAPPRPPLPTAAAQAPPLPLPLRGRRVAFTTPPAYAGRLARLLELRGAAPLPVPTVSVDPTPSTLAALARYFSPPTTGAAAASLAFTSRTGISAFALALSRADDFPPPLADSGDVFTVCALGNDAELLRDGGLLAGLCRNPVRVRVLVPEIASPAGLVEALGFGSGRRILCPVPEVVGLREPPVVPDFLRGLEAMGWAAVRVPAYETRWAGPGCAEALLGLDGPLDAILFTSTAEVEGLLKGLGSAGWEWGRVRGRWPGMLVAAHGPVTARGAERMGVRVDVVGSSFGSFDGVLDSLGSKWAAA